MQKLELTTRPALIGKSVNTRTENHGDDKVPGQDIPLFDLVLSPEELCAVTDEPSAYQAFFRQDGDQIVPRVQALEPQCLTHKFENATVEISGGTIAKTVYRNAKIKSIVLKPLTGGVTQMACLLQVNPGHSDPSAQNLINAKISISIEARLEEAKAAADPELPLDHGAASPGPDDETDPPGGDDAGGMSDMGRAIAVTAARAERKGRRKLN